MRRTRYLTARIVRKTKAKAVTTAAARVPRAKRGRPAWSRAIVRLASAWRELVRPRPAPTVSGTAEKRTSTAVKPARRSGARAAIVAVTTKTATALFVTMAAAMRPRAVTVSEMAPSRIWTVAVPAARPARSGSVVARIRIARPASVRRHAVRLIRAETGCLASARRTSIVAGRLAVGAPAVRPARRIPTA